VNIGYKVAANAAKGVGRKFSREGPKRPKISKKYRKIALFTSSRGEGGQRKKDQKIAKKAEK